MPGCRPECLCYAILVAIPDMLARSNERHEKGSAVLGVGCVNIWGSYNGGLLWCSFASPQKGSLKQIRPVMVQAVGRQSVHPE